MCQQAVCHLYNVRRVMPKFILRLKPIVFETNAPTQKEALTIFADVLMDRAYWLNEKDFVYIKEGTDAVED